MANPQKENGHLDIANEIVDKLTTLKLSGSEWQILWVIWRKTWAWHKKEDWVSLTQLEKFTGLSRVIVCRAKKRLVNKNILLSTKNGLSFNKNYDKWVVNKNTPLVNKSSLGSKQIVKGVVNENIHTKETITKETNTKEILRSEQSSQEEKQVNEIIPLFEPINPFYKKFYANKTQRGVIKRLLKQYGREKLETGIKMLPEIISKPYAPRITTPLKLEEKMGDLKIFIQQEQSKQGKIIKL